MAESSASSFEDPKLLAAAAYLLGGLLGSFAGGLAFISILVPAGIYVWKKSDAYVAFHSFQALLFTLFVFVLMYILGFLFVAQASSAYSNPYSYATGGGMMATYSLVQIIWGLGLVFFLVDLFVAYKAYSGEKFKLPVLGNMAEKPFF